MTVEVRLFGPLRERAGAATVALELPDDATVATALSRLAERPDLAGPLARMPVRMAVNREYAGEGDAIAPGDELALITPISGGAAPAARAHARISAEPISAETLTALVAHPDAGAIVAFQGVTRTVASLDYEAYREMAAERIEAILADVAARHGLLGAAAEHRVGNVPRGEPGVVVAVAAGHREEAFAAAREAIDRIKAEAPIWKRELDANGAGAWVEGAAAPEAR